MSTQNTSDAAQGLDIIKFAHDNSSYQVYLEVDEVPRARQLFDAQPWGGWIGLDALSGFPRVGRYGFDLRRRCANGNVDEAAGTMIFGTLDGPGCEGDFIPLPRFADSPCTRENFQINQVSTGGEESELYPISVFLAERDDFYLPPPLFKPIAVAYNVSKVIHGRYVVECNRSYPNVKVTVASNHTLVFDHWNLMYRKDGQCYLRVTDRSIYLGVADCGLYYLGPASGPPTGLIVGLCIAGLVVLCFLAAGGFAIYSYRRKILHAHFLLAFSESRQRNKTHVALKSTDQPVDVDEWLISSNDLETSSSILGHGHFSTVFKGSLKRKRVQATGTTPLESIVVAVKIANEGPNTTGDDIWREVQRHKDLCSHTHVVTMLGYVATDAKRPLLVFEYCSKGDVRKWLLESRRLSKGNDFDCAGYLRQQMSVAWQVSDGMAS
ncbi:insulin-related peptide receptor [Aphelenchoides avenae]|nr:insulin-related peptide receptor [Aphelenchus avenae]